MEGLEEFIIKYKATKWYLRLGIAGAIALLPGIYSYYTHAEKLQVEKEEAQEELDKNRTTFEQRRKRKQEIPKLEQQLLFTESQLAEVKKKLPQSIHIDDILQKTATLSHESNVFLAEFRPKAGLIKGTVKKFLEMPVEVSALGKYSEIASFMDKLINMEKLVKIANVTLTAKTLSAGDDRIYNGMDEWERTRVQRDLIRVEAKFSILLFRSLTESEESGLPQPTKEEKQDSKKEELKEEDQTNEKTDA